MSLNAAGWEKVVVDRIRQEFAVVQTRLAQKEADRIQGYRRCVSRRFRHHGVGSVSANQEIGGRAKQQC